LQTADAGRSARPRWRYFRQEEDQAGHHHRRKDALTDKKKKENKRPRTAGCFTIGVSAAAGFTPSAPAPQTSTPAPQQ